MTVTGPTHPETPPSRLFTEVASNCRKGDRDGQAPSREPAGNAFTQASILARSRLTSVLEGPRSPGGPAAGGPADPAPHARHGIIELPFRDSSPTGIRDQQVSGPNGHPGMSHRVANGPEDAGDECLGGPLGHPARLWDARDEAARRPPPFRDLRSDPARAPVPLPVAVSPLGGCMHPPAGQRVRRTSLGGERPPSQMCDPPCVGARRTTPASRHDPCAIRSGRNSPAPGASARPMRAPGPEPGRHACSRGVTKA